MPDCPISKDSYISGATTDVNKRYSKICFTFGQYGFTGSQWLKNQIFDLDTRFMNTLN